MSEIYKFDDRKYCHNLRQFGSDTSSHTNRINLQPHVAVSGVNIQLFF